MKPQLRREHRHVDDDSANIKAVQKSCGLVVIILDHVYAFLQCEHTNKLKSSITPKTSPGIRVHIKREEHRRELWTKKSRPVPSAPPNPTR